MSSSQPQTYSIKQKKRFPFDSHLKSLSVNMSAHGESCQCHLHKMPLEQTAEQFDFFTSIHGLVFRSMPITQVHRKITSQSAAWERTLTSAITEWRRRRGLLLNSLKKRDGVQFANNTSKSAEGLDAAKPEEQKCMIDQHNRTKGKGIVLFVEFIASRAATALSILTEHEGVTRYTSVAGTANSSQNANMFECLVSAEGVCRSEGALNSWAFPSLLPSFAVGSKQEEASAGIGGTTMHHHIVGEAVVAAVEAIVLFGALPRADVAKWYCEREKEGFLVSRTKRNDNVDDAYRCVGSTHTRTHTSSESETDTNSMESSHLPRHVAASLFFFWCMLQRSGTFSGVSAFSTSGSSRIESHSEKTISSFDQSHTSMLCGEEEEAAVKWLANSNCKAYTTTRDSGDSFVLHGQPLSPNPHQLVLGHEMKSALNLFSNLVQRALLLHSHSEKFLFFSPSPSDKAFCSFLARYITLNGQDASGYTPLHYCARGSGGGGGFGVGAKESSAHASQKSRSSDYLFLRALNLSGMEESENSSVTEQGFEGLDKDGSSKEDEKASDYVFQLSPLLSILSSESLVLSAIEKGEGSVSSSSSSGWRNDEAFMALLCPSIAKPRSSKKTMGADSMLSEHLASSIVNARLTTSISSTSSHLKRVRAETKKSGHTNWDYGEEGRAEELGSEKKGGDQALGETAQSDIARTHVNEGDNASVVGAVGVANTDKTSGGSLLTNEKMVAGSAADRTAGTILAELEKLHSNKSVHLLTRAMIASGVSCVSTIHEAFSRAAAAGDSSGDNGKGGMPSIGLGAFIGLGLPGGGNPTGGALSRPTGATADQQHQQLNVTSYTTMPSSIADLYVSRMPIVPTRTPAPTTVSTAVVGAANVTACTPLQLLEWSVLAGGAANVLCATPAGWQTPLQRASARGRAATVRYLLEVFSEVAGRALLSSPASTVSLLDTPSSLSSPASGSCQEVVAGASSAVAAKAFAALRRYCVEGEDSSGRSALSLAQDECPTDGGLREVIVALLVAC